MFLPHLKCKTCSEGDIWKISRRRIKDLKNQGLYKSQFCKTFVGALDLGKIGGQPLYGQMNLIYVSVTWGVGKGVDLANTFNGTKRVSYKFLEYLVSTKLWAHNCMAAADRAVIVFFKEYNRIRDPNHSKRFNTPLNQNKFWIKIPVITEVITQLVWSILSDHVVKKKSYKEYQ